MTCQQFDKLMLDYVDGKLSRKQRKEVRAHLHRCSACTAVLNDYQNMIAAVRKLPREKCPDSVMDGVFAALPVKEKGVAKKIHKWFTQDWGWKVSFAAAVLLIVITAILFRAPDKILIDENQSYTQQEVEQAKKEIELALGYFNRYAQKTGVILEEQVLDKALAKPVRSTLKIAVQPLINGGSK